MCTHLCSLNSFLKLSPGVSDILRTKFFRKGNLECILQIHFLNDILETNQICQVVNLYFMKFKIFRVFFKKCDHHNTGKILS